MPKKNQKNSYYYFMLDFQARELQKGRNLSIAQVSVEAGPEWSVSCFNCNADLAVWKIADLSVTENGHERPQAV